MGPFSKLFGNKHQSAQQIISPSIDVKPKPTIALFNQLVDTIVFSEPVRENLKRKLTEAFANPEHFFDEQGEFILSDRGLTYPKSTSLIPKFVFIDTLMAEGQMVEVDWKEDETEIRASATKIMKTKQFPFILSATEKYENESTYDIIQLINEGELIPNGYTLQILDINSDCYVFTIVPIEQSKLVAALFAQLK